MTDRQELVSGAADVEDPPPYQPSYGSSDVAPPSYNAVSTHPGDTPPSYDSLYGELKDAKAQSTGILEFFKKFLIIIVSTLGCTICVGLVLAIPISMIAIGSVYLNQCPCERFIPIYLIVGGVFGIIRNISSMGQRFKNQREEESREQTAKTNPIDGVISCFLLVWFIAGNVWIYKIYDEVITDSSIVDAACYCNFTLYWYSFWVTTAVYITMLMSCCCVCCAGFLSNCCLDRNAT